MDQQDRRLGAARPDVDARADASVVLDIPAVVRYMADSLHVLAHLHGLGIIHRDIKHGNRIRK